MCVCVCIYVYVRVYVCVLGVSGNGIFVTVEMAVPFCCTFKGFISDSIGHVYVHVLCYAMLKIETYCNID